nr:hypothetical protein [Jiangella alkaliphila]
MRRVAGQQDPAHAVARGQPRGVAEAGQPARRVNAEVGARERPQPHLDLVERRLGAVLGHVRGGHDDTERPLAARPDAERAVFLAHLGDDGGQLVRRHADVHLAGQPLGAGRLAGEVDAEQLAHGAAAAVTADQPARAQPRPVGQFGGDTVVVLAEPGQRAAAPDLRAQLLGVRGQQAVGDRLPDAQDVRVRGVQPLGQRPVDAGEVAAERVFRAPARNRSSRPRWSISSMLRTCRPSERTTGVGSASFSTTSTWTPRRRSSAASMWPVGPPPATMTSIMRLRPAGKCLVSG